MKRTTSTLAAFGLALSGSVALAGAYIPPGGRLERQPAADQPPPPHDAAPRPDAGQGGPRGGGWGNSRGGERRDDRRDERRDERRHEGRGDRRDDGARHSRDRGPDRDHDRHDRGQDRRWSDGRGDWDRDRVPPRHDSRGHDDRRWREPSRPTWSTGRFDHDRGPTRGWRDERGREWRYRREWYDQYRADRWRYDRGRWVARERFSLGIYVIPRGYPVRYWQRGQWLPAAYYVERRWHLGDYWRYGLYDPPYAAGWVRVGDDALLVDLRSGEVLDVVCELFW